MTPTPEPLTATVEIQFGSEWQEEVWGQSFKLMMSALKMQMESKHQKNNLTVTIHDE